LALNGTDLYAAGFFNNAGNVAANYIAHWNGAAWSALDTGANLPVYALAFGSGGLYAGGSFTAVGAADLSASHVARWDGAKWNALGAGVDQDVLSLTVGANTLYAGGPFSKA